MRNTIVLLAMLCSAVTPSWAQRSGFVLKGEVKGMRDGVNVALLVRDSVSRTLAETVAKNGKFELRGTVEHPCRATLITNNLELVGKYNLPTDSIKWTYTDCYIDNADMVMDVRHYKDIPSDWSVTPDFCLKGGQVQEDFNDYGRMLYERSGGDSRKIGEIEEAAVWDFILSHPQSVVSVYFANGMLRRGYRLTADEVERLEQTITDVPGDKAAFAEFKELLAYAKQTVVGASMVDLEMKDTVGVVQMLSTVVPKGKFVLVDFWASWCGMCIHAMPEVKEIAEKYSEDFVVIGLSCDKDEKAWRGAMERVKMPWAQYVLTAQGFEDFFKKYQVGNGVPYYMLIAPDGKVLKTPSHPSDVRKVLSDRIGYANLSRQLFSQSDALTTEKLLEQKTFADCRAYVAGQVKPLEERLAQIDDPYFVVVEKAAINESVVTSCYNYAIAREKSGVRMADDAGFMDFVGGLDLNDTLQASNTMNYLNWYLAAHADEYADMPEDAARLRIAGKLVESKAVLNKIVEYTMAMRAFLMMFGGNLSDSQADVCREILAVSTDENVRDYARKELEKAKFQQPGAEAADLKMLDREGKTVSLRDIVGKGRYTYIDFWATWCGPCVKEIPHLESLAKTYGEDSSIRIVSISLDEDIQKWEQKLAADNPGWAQYRVPKEWQAPCSDCYDISGIPRFMLFDKEGRMLKTSAPRPSDENLKDLFNQLK